MNTNKIGAFIKQLREKQNMSQEKLANKLFVTRQAVSSWENGKYIPDIDKLKLLAEIFEVSIMDLYAGEKIQNNIKEENNVIYNAVKNENNKTKTIIKLFIGTVLIMIFTFLFYYFLVSYKSIKVYLLSMVYDNITINGIMIASKENTYFNLNVDGIEIKNMALIYDDENQKTEIYKTEDNLIFFRDNYGYDEYVSNINLNNFVNNLYIEIIGVEEEYKIKLNLQKDFENKGLLFLKKNRISKEEQYNDKIKIPIKIIENFEEKNGNYELKIQKDNQLIYLNYNINANLFLVDEEETNAISSWIYYITSNTFHYEKVDSQGKVLNTLDGKLNKEFNEEEEQLIRYFETNYLEKYLRN